MLTQIFDWVFHWILLYLAFELGRRWNEKDVAASIAAITETQSRRRSDEFPETPERLMVSEAVVMAMLMLGPENIEGKSCVADGEGEKKTF